MDKQTLKVQRKYDRYSYTENSSNYLSLDSRWTGGGFSEFSVSEISNKPRTLVCGKMQEISDVYDWFETINNIKKAGLKPKYKNLALFDVFKRIEAVK